MLRTEQERAGQQRQGDVVVPAPPRTHLVSGPCCFPPGRNIDQMQVTLSEPVRDVDDVGDVLADLGTSPDELRELCEEETVPMDALAVVAEAGGFAEVLDSLR